MHEQIKKHWEFEIAKLKLIRIVANQYSKEELIGFLDEQIEHANRQLFKEDEAT